MSAKNEQKRIALAKALKLNVDEIEIQHDSFVTDDGEEYLIMNDDERKEAVIESIKETASYFNASFLSDMTELDEVVFEALVDKNEAVVRIIEKCCDGGLVSFAKKAVEADGFGHFLSSYDSEEHELSNGLFAYRVS